jgi:hypothetical protein
MSKVIAKAKHVASKCGPPRGKYMNRPSIEYSGTGDQLCYDAWGGRWFRASIEAVNEGIQFLRDAYVDGIQEIEEGTGYGKLLNYNDLYNVWNISDTLPGGLWGWSPSEDWRVDMEFITVLAEVGEHDLADKMGESVYIIEPAGNSLPFESYMEV